MLALPYDGGLLEPLGLLERRLLVLSSNRPVDLFAIDADVGRGLDPEPHLIPLHLEHPDGDGVTHPDHLAQLPCQDQHRPEGTVPAPLSPLSAIPRPSLNPRTATDWRGSS